MSTLLDAALDYAEAGIPVFPCRRFDKKPYTIHGFHDATTDPVLIREWWTRWPEGLIGTPCIDFWVLDIDGTYGEESVAKIAEGRPIHTATVQTSRGLHYYFRGRGPRQGTNVNGHPGLDVRSNGRGYVILPPSVHHSGHVYQWVVDFDEFADAPAWLVEALGGIEPDSPQPQPAETSSRPNTFTPKLRQDLASALAVLPADDYQTWVEIGMALESTGGGETAFSIWLEWSRKSPKFRGEEDCYRHWRTFGRRPSEITASTVFHYAKTLGWEPPKPVPELGKPPQTPAPKPLLASLDWSVEGFHDAKCPTRYLLMLPTSKGEPAYPGTGDPFMARGKTACLAAEGGSSKTTSLCALAISLGAKLPWLGHFHVKADAPRSSCILCGEDTLEEIKFKLREVGDHLRLTAEQIAAVAQHVKCIAVPGLQPLVRWDRQRELMEPTENLHAFVERLRANPPTEEGWGAVLIDTLSRFTAGGVEADNERATQMWQILENLGLDLPGQPTIMMAMHSSKTAREAGEVNARGVTALTDTARLSIGLVNGKGNRVTMKVGKNNYGPSWFDVSLVRLGRGVLLAEDEASKAEAQAKLEAEKEQKTLTAAERKAALLDKRREPYVGRSVEAARANPGLTKTELARIVGGNFTDAQHGISLALARGQLENRGTAAKGAYYAVW